MAALPLPLLATASEGLAVWQPGVDAPLVDSLPHDAPVSCLRWTTDDRVLASTSADGCVVLTRLEREAVDRLQVAPSGSGVAVLSLTWSPGSRYLATGASDAAIRVFDLRKGVQALTLRGHRAAVRSISWSPSEVYVASASDSGDILVHRVQGSVAVVARLEHPLYATRISATAPPPVGYVQWATFQPSLLAAGADDGTVTIWDVVPSASVLAPLHAFNEHSDACTGVQWSPVNQHLLVSASTDGWLVFYDVTKRARLREIQVVEPITAFSLSHDSLFIACGTATGKLRLFDLRVTRDSAVWTVQAHDGPLSCVSFQRLGMRPPVARGGSTPSAPPQLSTPDSRAHRSPPPPEASGRPTPPPSFPTPAAERAAAAVATPASAVAARCKPPRQTEQAGAEAEGGASTGAAARADGALPRWLPSRLTGRMGDACLDERSPAASSWDASSTQSSPDAGAAAETSGVGGEPCARLAPRKAWQAELDYDCPSSSALPKRAGATRTCGRRETDRWSSSDRGLAPPTSNYATTSCASSCNVRGW
ncbi:hypothetical protein AB1Y20_012709 [Prymnesium parvum]|uniref:Anaphase-promoting complex subunit 4-like WD40 domain-containing protein n=1 Tax=Prymnesium parvum TaxID=97485 RepID=A0AB34IK55_PRYPA